MLATHTRAQSHSCKGDIDEATTISHNTKKSMGKGERSCCKPPTRVRRAQTEETFTNLPYFLNSENPSSPGAAKCASIVAQESSKKKK